MENQAKLWPCLSKPRAARTPRLLAAALLVLSPYLWPLPGAAGLSDMLDRAAELAQKLAQDFLAGLEDLDVNALRKAAEAGDAEAQVMLGRMYRSGEGVPQDHEQALSWFRKAEAQGNAQALYYLGLMAHSGQGMPKNLEQAHDWYLKSAEQGFVLAQYNLGCLYADVNGEGAPRDDARAAFWWRKAADQGFERAQVWLGNLYADGRGVPKDEKRAVALYKKAADQDSAVARFNLGNMYFWGRGVAKDEKRAAEWYRQAADQGYAAARTALAALCYWGRGVDKDEERAMALYREAAEQGHVEAQRALGRLLYRGRPGAPPNPEEAAEWLGKAAAQGDQEAVRVWADLSCGGQGEPDGGRTCVRLLTSMAEDGDAHAQFQLGMVYHEGRFVPKDREKTLFWLRRAADQGNGSARHNLRVIEGRPLPPPKTPEEARRRDEAAAVGLLFEERNGLLTPQTRFELGKRRLEGRGMPKDEADGLRQIRRAADEGDAEARNFLRRLDPPAASPKRSGD